MQQKDRDGFDIEPGELFPQRANLPLVERFERFALGEHPFVELEAHRAFYQRTVLLEEQVVGVGPVDPADFVDVAKSLVMTSAARAPVLSSIVLMAIVEPCRKSAASANATPALSTPAAIPSTRCEGVDSALPSLSAPVAGSKAAIIGERAADIGGEPQPAGNFRIRHAWSEGEKSVRARLSKRARAESTGRKETS